MPQLIPVVVSAIVTGVAVGEGFAFAWAFAVFAIGLASSLLVTNLASFEQRQSGLSKSSKNPAQAGRQVYGMVRVGGVVTYIETTGENNDFLHMIITLTYHRVEEILTVYLDDTPIHMHHLQQDGFLTHDNRFSWIRGKGAANREMTSLVRIQTDVGITNGSTINAQPFPDLQAESDGKWKIDHKQLNKAKIYVRLQYGNPANVTYVWPNGIPNITAVVRGRRVLDTRDDTTSWDPNPALCLRHWLVDPRARGGMGVDPDTEIDIDSFNAAANECDERVLVNNANATGNPASDFILLSGTDYVDPESRGVSPSSYKFFPIHFSHLTADAKNRGIDISTGDGVRFFNDQASIDEGRPSGMVGDIDTTFYVVIKGYGEAVAFDNLDPGQQEQTIELVNDGANYFNRLSRSLYLMGFAETYEDALAGNAIESIGSPNISGGLNTQVRMYKYDEARYQMHGVVEFDRKPQDILSDMLSSFGGRLIYSGGVFRLAGYAAVTPEFEFDETDLRGPIQVTPKVGRRERVNTVKGVYVSTAANYTLTNYTAQSRSIYVTNDNGEVLAREYNLAFTTSSTMAQRLARISLEKGRQEITTNLQMNLSGMLITAGDVIQITNANLGWSSKEFEVLEWVFAPTQDAQGDPIIGVNVFIKEYAAGVFDWDPTTDEGSLPDDWTIDTDLPDPFEVAPPTNLEVVEESYESNTGVGLEARARVTWTASTDFYVEFYQLEWRIAGVSTLSPLPEEPYNAMPRTRDVVMVVNQMESGFYDFRLAAINQLGVFSEYIEVLDFEIAGIPDEPPGDMTGLSVTPTMGGNTALVTWDKSTSASVRRGGSVLIRHDSDTFSGDWGQSISLGSPEIPGDLTEKTVSIRNGFVLGKFQDAYGQVSVNAAEFAVTETNPWNAVDVASSPFVDDPAFAGMKDNVQLVNSAIRLPLDESVSPSLEVQSPGTYYSSHNTVNLGLLKTVLLRPTIDVTIIQEGDTIDERLDPIDEWPDFDNGIDGSEANVRIQIRWTEADPAVSPTSGFTEWATMDAALVDAWGVEWRLVITSTGSNTNIEVNALSMAIQELP